MLLPGISRTEQFMAHLKGLYMDSGGPVGKGEALAEGTQQESCEPSGMAVAW